MASFPITGTKTFPILPSPQITNLHPPISFKTYKKPGPLKWILLSSSSGAVTASSSEPNSPFSSPSTSSSSLYSAKVYELTAENVNMVLDDVRPYLIADGGDVDVVGVDDGVVSLQLQGACGSCASSTTTMKMGIERVLKEKFGDAIKEIRQVSDDLQTSITDVVAVNRHLDILRPAIKNYGGSVEVISIENGDCHVKYVGPDSIGSGIRAAIKEKFPDIVNIIFSDD